MSELAILPANSPKSERAQALGQWNSALPNEQIANEFEWRDPATGGSYILPRLPYWVKFAIEVGYVKPGYALQDYLNGAITGFPGDPIKRSGFNMMALCAEMGVGKSSLSMQLSAQVYGEEVAGEWEPDWDSVLKYTIHTRDQILPMWKAAREMSGRIKVLNLDDIDSIFGTALWFEDRPLCIKLRRAVNKIRPRVANMIVSAPSLNDVNHILHSKITFEVKPFPNQTYMAERYCGFVDQFSTISDFKRKIMTEYSKFELSDVPPDVFKEYDAGRMESEDEDIEELEKAMKRASDKQKKKKGEEDAPETEGPDIDAPMQAKVIPRRMMLKCLDCGHTWTTSKKPNRCPSCRKYNLADVSFGV